MTVVLAGATFVLKVATPVNVDPPVTESVATVEPLEFSRAVAFR
jgi:hypothetical protein